MSYVPGSEMRTCLQRTKSLGPAEVKFFDYLISKKGEVTSVKEIAATLVVSQFRVRQLYNIMRQKFRDIEGEHFVYVKRVGIGFFE